MTAVGSRPACAAVLGRIVKANATFSAGCGLAATAAARPLACFLAPAAGTLLGLPLAAALIMPGVGLIAYGAILYVLASRGLLRSAVVRTIAALDAGWTVGTALLLAFFSDDISGAGIALLASLAVVTAIFAVAQVIGAQRLGARVPAAS